MQRLLESSVEWRQLVLRLRLRLRLLFSVFSRTSLKERTLGDPKRAIAMEMRCEKGLIFHPRVKKSAAGRREKKDGAFMYLLGLIDRDDMEAAEVDRRLLRQ
ncbi:hypothetical protein SAY87_001439 [Trapa incisa]|uniref:Uncharacterized protein n=1 Tax=Trapa incisa TaxID=236973 RepID=A0AAN7JHV2_9MYRT|nr:hypothetical protein SAY87_001439 [Trapa incisa]